MESFCTRSGISQEFSAPITPQQNSVVEKKNRAIQEIARAMLHNKDVVRNLWGEAVNTACHTINMVYFRPGTKKTSYELWKGRKPNVLSILEFLEVLVSFSRIERMWVNLTPKVMKEYFWDTSLQVRLIRYTTREPKR